METRALPLAVPVPSPVPGPVTWPPVGVDPECAVAPPQPTTAAQRSVTRSLEAAAGGGSASWLEAVTITLIFLLGRGNARGCVRFTFRHFDGVGESRDAGS